MIGEGIRTELSYAGAMILYGCVVSLGYHVLLFFRACIAHAKAVTDAEDILFLMSAGFGFFLVAFEKNNGVLRWYAFAGFVVGIYAYYQLLAPGPERVRKWLLQKKRKTFKIKAAEKEKHRSRNKKRKQVLLRDSSSPESEEKGKEKKRN